MRALGYYLYDTHGADSTTSEDQIREFCEEKQHNLVKVFHSNASSEIETFKEVVTFIKERKLILSSLRQIDEIITYKTEDDLLKILKNRKIDIRFQGDDYKEKNFTGQDLDIPIHFLDRSHGWSTTKFKKLLSNNI